MMYVNLQDNLDVVFMRNFFAGLAQCGAWACLDEFNRIDVEVLSVVAQYIIVLQLAQKAAAEIIEFEGRTIKIVSSFGIFITVRSQ
jgi:dynein heavy chain